MPVRLAAEMPVSFISKLKKKTNSLILDGEGGSVKHLKGMKSYDIFVICPHFRQVNCLTSAYTVPNNTVKC